MNNIIKNGLLIGGILITGLTAGCVLGYKSGYYSGYEESTKILSTAVEEIVTKNRVVKKFVDGKIYKVLLEEIE
jgi:hypothetical protein